MLNYRQLVPAAIQPIQLAPDIGPDGGESLESGTLEATAWVFKALSDPARLKIIQHLASGRPGCCGDGVCACDLEMVTGLSQPTVSHHMKCLASAGLIRAEKRGKWIYYTLEQGGLRVARMFLACC